MCRGRLLYAGQPTSTYLVRLSTRSCVAAVLPRAPPPCQAGGNSDELQEKSKEMKKKIQETEEKEKDVIKTRDSKVVAIGNIVHDSVPVSQDEVCGGGVGRGEGGGRGQGTARCLEQLHAHVAAAARTAAASPAARGVTDTR